MKSKVRTNKDNAEYQELKKKAPDYYRPSCSFLDRREQTKWVTYMLTPFRSVKHSTRTVAVPSAQGRTVRTQGPDGLRPGARRGGALCAGRTVRGLGPDGPRPGARLGLLPDDRMVRALGPDGPRPGAGRSARTQGRRKIADGAWISLPGGTPSGSRDPRLCLGSGWPT
jgi:hypothetical protein